MKKMIMLGLVCMAGISGNQVWAQLADSTKRLVKLEGTVNFRDIGGYPTDDGKIVKWGKIYRSEALDKLTDADRDSLGHRKIDHVVDFRGNGEAAKAPDKLPENTNYLLLPAGSASTDLKKIFEQMTDGEKAMETFYSNTGAMVPRYRPFFQEVLALPDSSALVFHCTAGKDRTGIAAALLLFALGVSEDVILSVFLATNTYRKEENSKGIQHLIQMGVSQTVASDIMAVKTGYLRAALDAINKEYGSVQGFFHRGLGLTDVDIRTLKQKFVEE
ncbi:tyrosine-protein phosphatase [Sphingobacterium spiritivorum]|uniref:tyrosine-protein phosphatase n=1 Tax=Sphingobacterium spiritivorum TaxID=258 RepID=UPI003DA50F2D